MILRALIFLLIQQKCNIISSYLGSILIKIPLSVFLFLLKPLHTPISLKHFFLQKKQYSVDFHVYQHFNFMKHLTTMFIFKKLHDFL